MPEKHKNKTSSKKNKNKKEKPKKLSKEEKEAREKKELEKLNKELVEVDLEIKKVALNNKKVILDNWEEEKEGLTSNLGLEIKNTSPSLEMVNAPQRRLVPLERTLQVETQSPNLLGNNKSNGEEFNPFKYSAGGAEAEGPKYISYESFQGVQKVDVQKLATNPNERKEIGFTPTYTPETNSEMQEKVFNPVKRKDISELGRGKDSDFKKEVKYTPSDY